MSLLLNITKLLLLGLSGIGFYSTWYLVMNNGGADFMADLRDHGPHTLPYTDEAPLKKHYTGIGLVDYQLTVLTLFFYNIVDGSHPNASLQAYHFAGQIIAGWSLLMLESLRAGNRMRLVSFIAIWGFVMQNAAFAVVIPLYLVIHLSTSPTVCSRKQSDFIPWSAEPLEVTSLPYAVALGFILPTIAMVLPAPSIVNYERKQLLIAIWQAFPVWVGILQQIIVSSRRYFQQVAIIEYEATKKRTFDSMRTVYGLMLTAAVVTRVSAWTISFSALLFPSIFAPNVVILLTPSAVFKPAGFTASVKMPSIAAGSLQFLQYDEMVGAAAMILWSATLYLNIMKKKNTLVEWMSLMVKGFAIGAIAGPQGLAVAAMWARDEIISAEDYTERKKL
ncbi:MAG: hypothetical protein Q9170_007054 [Blastenia crenularia]